MRPLKILREGGQGKVDGGDEDDIIEIELRGETVEPDDDPPQKVFLRGCFLDKVKTCQFQMGDPSVEIN